METVHSVCVRPLLCCRGCFLEIHGHQKATEENTRAQVSSAPGWTKRQIMPPTQIPCGYSFPVASSPRPHWASCFQHKPGSGGEQGSLHPARWVWPLARDGWVGEKGRVPSTPRTPDNLRAYKHLTYPSRSIRLKFPPAALSLKSHPLPTCFSTCLPGNQESASPFRPPGS